MRKWYVTLSLALLTLTQQALACPGCKDALSQKGASSNPWGAAFNLSIMFMLGTVLTIVGMATLFFRKMVKDEERRAAGNVTVSTPRRALPLKVVLPALALLYVAGVSWATVRALAAGTPKQISVDAVTYEITDQSFASTIANQPVLVDFGAKWCEYCKQTAPAFKQLAQDSGAQMKCVTVDVERCPATAKAYSIDELPCIILFQNGRETARRTGVASYAELKSWVASKATAF